MPEVFCYALPDECPIWSAVWRFMSPPLSRRLSRRPVIFVELVKDPDDRDLAACEAAVDRCFASEDYLEGRQAFMEKREPQFKGR